LISFSCINCLNLIHRKCIPIFCPGVQSAATPASIPSTNWVKFAPTVFVASCSDTALTVLGPSPRTGATYRISCPSQCLAAKSPVYGCSRTNAFSAQSALCRTALHAGAYQNANGGIFELTIVASTAASYCASGASSLFSSNADRHNTAARHIAASVRILARLFGSAADCHVHDDICLGLRGKQCVCAREQHNSFGTQSSVRQSRASAPKQSSSQASNVIGCLRANYFDANSTLCAAAAHSFIETDAVFQIVTAPAASASFCNETFNAIPSASNGIQLSTSVDSVALSRRAHRDGCQQLAVLQTVSDRVSARRWRASSRLLPAVHVLRVQLDLDCRLLASKHVYGRVGGVPRCHARRCHQLTDGRCVSRQCRADADLFLRRRVELCVGLARLDVPVGQIAFALQLTPNEVGMYLLLYSLTPSTFFSRRLNRNCLYSTSPCRCNRIRPAGHPVSKGLGRSIRCRIRVATRCQHLLSVFFIIDVSRR
jgi:hypothetical protein